MAGVTKVGDKEYPVFDADCVTLNGYMGSDAIKPFLDQCTARNKSAFVLAKTSNPSSMEFQDMVAGDRVVYAVMGDLIERWGRDTAGKYGYQALGAVVGATIPRCCGSCAARLPHTFFLVPGYGAQGGTARPTCATPLTSWAGGHHQRLPLHHVRVEKDREGRRGPIRRPPGRSRADAGRAEGVHHGSVKPIRRP